LVTRAHDAGLIARGAALTDAKQVIIDVPDLNEDQLPCKHAYAFKLTGLGF
jgi:hypothetical protein